MSVNKNQGISEKNTVEYGCFRFHLNRDDGKIEENNYAYTQIQIIYTCIHISV